MSAEFVTMETFLSILKNFWKLPGGFWKTLFQRHQAGILHTMDLFGVECSFWSHPAIH